jgi:hypothetical protein
MATHTVVSVDEFILSVTQQTGIWEVRGSKFSWEIGYHTQESE